MARVSSFELNNSVRATTPDNAIAELAKRQHGVIAYSQLLALGLDRNAVVYRVTVGRLHRLHKGVYAVGHAKVSWLGQVTAAVKACGAGAVISHRTAADLWGIRKTSSPRIEVTTTRRIRSPGIVVHQTRRLQDGERMRHEGIPVTAPGRTLDDLGRVLPPDQLQRAVE